MVSSVSGSLVVPDEQENSERKKTLEYKCAIKGDAAADEDENEDEDDDFEFAFVPQGQDVDDLFGDGERHPVYPVFDQSLLHDGGGGEVVGLTSSFRELSVGEGEKRTTSGQDEVELPAGNYCVWSREKSTPPLDASKKSRSTGTSSSRRWKLMDLVVGRSRSDGKEKFHFLAPPPNAAAERKKVAAAKKAVKEMDMKTAHKMYYGSAGAGAGDRKQSSYLPYRKGLVGFRPF